MTQYFENDIPLIIFVPEKQHELRPTEIPNAVENKIQIQNTDVRTLCKGTIYSCKNIDVDGYKRSADVDSSAKETATTSIRSSHGSLGLEHETHSFNELSEFDRSSNIYDGFEVYYKNTLIILENEVGNKNLRGRRREFHPKKFCQRLMNSNN